MQSAILCMSSVSIRRLTRIIQHYRAVSNGTCTPLRHGVLNVARTSMLHSKASLAWLANCKRALVSLHSAPADDLSRASMIHPGAPITVCQRCLGQGDEGGSISFERVMGALGQRLKAKTKTEMSRGLAA